MVFFVSKDINLYYINMYLLVIIIFILWAIITYQFMTKYLGNFEFILRYFVYFRELENIKEGGERDREKEFCIHFNSFYLIIVKYKEISGRVKKGRRRKRKM